MKVLLRKYNGKPYVWEKASYTGSEFVVNGCTVQEGDVISVMNDNRKNYVKCSSCGQIFRKGSDAFEIHQQQSKGTNMCLTCPNLSARDCGETQVKYVPNGDGTYKKKTVSNVSLYCGGVLIFGKYELNDEVVTERCKYRRCHMATATEVSDFFTTFPGAFDDIITVDKVIDSGYVDFERYGDDSEYGIQSDFYIRAYVNSIGIVQSFFVDYDGEYYTLLYSKKYDVLFELNSNGKYVVWDPPCEHEVVRQIKEDIAKLYR